MQMLYFFKSQTFVLQMQIKYLLVPVQLRTGNTAHETQYVQLIVIHTVDVPCLHNSLETQTYSMREIFIRARGDVCI